MPLPSATSSQTSVNFFSCWNAVTLDCLLCPGRSGVRGCGAVDGAAFDDAVEDAVLEVGLGLVLHRRVAGRGGRRVAEQPADPRVDQVGAGDGVGEMAELLGPL